MPAELRSTPLVTVGIITYNSESYLADCFAALSVQTYQPFVVLIVDNASQDNTRSMLHRVAPDARVIALETNIGHSAACNRILDEADTPFVLFLDHDTILDPDALEQLVQAVEGRDTPTIATARVIQESPPHRTYDGLDLHYLGVGTYHKPHVGNDPVFVPLAGSTALLVPREQLSDGRFDPDYFIYSNDIDYVYGQRLRGAQCIAVPTAIVRHREGTANLSGRDRALYPSKRYFFIVRNRARFVLKNFSLQTLLVTFIPQLVHEIVLLLFGIVQRMPGVWFRAHWSNLSRIGGILRERRKVQRSRTIRDRQLLSANAFTFTGSIVHKWWLRVLAVLLSFIYTLYWWITSWVLAR